MTALVTTSNVINPITDPIGRYVWGIIYEGVMEGATTGRATITLGQRAQLVRAVYTGLQQAGAQVTFGSRLPAIPEDTRP